MLYEVITIRITPVGFNPKQCLIRPQSYGLAYTIENNTFVIEIDRPRKISIEFDNSVEHALLLFADAPETDIPDKSDKHLIYYEPGFHSMAEPLKVAPNQKVYVITSYSIHYTKLYENHWQTHNERKRRNVHWAFGVSRSYKII